MTTFEEDASDTAEHGGTADHADLAPTAPAEGKLTLAEVLELFAGGRLPFRGIVDVVARVTGDAPRGGNPRGVAEVVEVEEWARRRARELVAESVEGRQPAGSGG